MATRVFVLEDDPQRIRLFAEMLADCDWHCIQTARRHAEFEPPYDVIFLDHDLGGRQMEQHEDCGLTFVRLVKDRINPEARVVVHSYNQPAAMRMIAELDNRAVYQPFLPSALSAYLPGPVIG